MTRAATPAVLIAANGSHTVAHSYSDDGRPVCDMLTVPLLTYVERDRKRFGANGEGVVWSWKPLAARFPSAMWLVPAAPQRDGQLPPARAIE